MRITLIATLLLILPGTALAAGGDESWEMWEARQIMLAEMERARKLGGFSDPLTAVRNIARGQATARDVVSPYRTLYDLPEYGGPPVEVPDQRP